ncbi:MAG: paraquat-inducible protein A [Phycisphaerales bacterium]|nr:paraquat-inducible protein A [Phycisphaerales bacterium]MCB9835156.1 paraquat-inducible protein A [Phycisphaera sp.]
MSFRACATCGLVHEVPSVPAKAVARCTRCRSVIRHGTHPAAESRTAALAAAALILYIPALTLPVMTLSRLGHESTNSIWSGTVALLAEGHYPVGLTIFFFSIVAPVAKLSALFALCFGRRWLSHGARASTYHAVEFIGRWGMLDVLLVAILVAIVKLGDLVTVTPGPGVVVFGVVVLLSMLATISFDPHAIWEEDA